MTTATPKATPVKAAEIISASGGKIIGRTKLQKVGYLLELVGLGDGFTFSYKHYGPYSPELASAAKSAALIGLLHEEEKPTSWGGTYSIFTTDSHTNAAEARRKFAEFASSQNSVELELAATAAYLAIEGYKDAWAETERRKPEKTSQGRLEKAKVVYAQLRNFDTPEPLPEIL